MMKLKGIENKALKPKAETKGGNPAPAPKPSSKKGKC